MNRHRRLKIWREAGDLLDDVYALTRLLPADEGYVAATQLRRAAWSVQNNIAEGNAKLGDAERRRFLDVSLGSLAEVDSMAASLARLYELDRNVVTRIEERRALITAGIFALLRNRRRP